MTETKKDAKPEVAKTHDDGRKDDHLGDSHPRPQGHKHGDGWDVELQKRAKFLKDNPFKPYEDK